jgi:ribose/xylose/arabinose/galactoside ABC-type transport system permease subunit
VNRLLQIFAKRPVLITVLVCLIMYLVTGLTSDTAFFNGYTFVALFQNNAALGIVAVGMTFVILTGGGGIDLSVSSVMGWTALLVAYLISVPGDKQPSFFHNWNPYLAMLVVVATATLIGGIVGVMVHHLEIPPFLITLAFLFLYRGWALVITTEEVSVAKNHSIVGLADWAVNIVGIDRFPVAVRMQTILLLVAVAIGSWLGRYTGFGRSLYAIGGSENSALLMGLPVARSKVIVYALSGFCASLGGVIFLVKDRGGAALRTRGLELDAIAITVIGGTLLTGGVGGIPGTLIGVLTYTIIYAFMARHSFQTGVDRMVIGALLLAFILLQKLLQYRRRA